MPESCPYCGEETGALKNHVRLSSGDGHGPSGEYPADFNQSNSGTSSSDDTGNQVSTATDGGAVAVDDRGDAGLDDADDGVNMTQEEFDDAIQAAAEAAREEGYEEGYREGYEAGYEEALQEPDSGDTGGSQDTQGLPCGHETLAPAEAPEPPYRVSCDICGQSWRVTA